jgi:hypothetical protein
VKVEIQFKNNQKWLKHLNLRKGRKNETVDQQWPKTFTRIGKDMAVKEGG